MINSVTTPLQLTASAALLNNTGINGLPADLTAALLAFNNLTVISYLRNSINTYAAQSFATAGTLLSLQSLGSTDCPALGDSIPAAPLGSFTNLTPVINPSGFTGLIEQTGDIYLGDGDIGKFTQGFMAVQGYITSTNDFINSSVNANEYLGPTFTTMDDLVTNSITIINTNLEGFGVDLANQGQLIDLSKLELYGTPAGVLQQLSKVARIQGQSLPAIQTALINAGMTTADITDLIKNNRIGLFNPTGLTANEFDRLQKTAYSVLNSITDDDLAQVLSILDITTPNITNMAQLLDPIVMFPNSYSTMRTPSPGGPILIFNNTSVNSNVVPVVATYLPTPSGCDDLGKIIPPADAVANKAIQVSLQQITGVANTTLRRMSEAVRGSTNNIWNINNEYLVDTVVAVGAPIPTNYRAIQDVPIGTDIVDASYWVETDLGLLSTMTGLPLIEAQTTAVDPTVTTFFTTNIATGTGPDGTINTCDVLGTALGLTHTDQLVAATITMNTLITAGALAALTATYNSMQTASTEGAMIGYIATAVTDIAAVVSAYPTETTALNVNFVAMADRLSSEKTYQTKAGIDYFQFQDGEQSSIYAFVQNLPTYAQDTVDCGANEFLIDIVDTTIIGGQAIVGALREGRNDSRLAAANITTDANRIPSDPVVTP